MRIPVLALPLLVALALAPAAGPAAAETATSAASDPQTGASKSKPIEPMVAPVRRVVPVTPPPRKVIKGVKADAGEKAAAACAKGPRKGLEPGCPASAAAKLGAKAAKTQPKAGHKVAPKPGQRTAEGK